MKRLTLLLTCFFIGMGLAIAQNKQITGIVLDEEEEPAIGVSVIVKGTSLGTVTGMDGTFTFSIPQNANTLIFKYLGYKDKEIPVSPNMVITLDPDSRALDEVMIVAYGTAKKESFTGSAEILRPEKLEKRTVADITKALDGLVAGVQSTSGSGQPGSGAEIIIRGFGSINASQNPLYVVDGIPYDGKINAINPNDIESISILKDAAASTLYGARGANGVIMITTKKGREGDTKVNLKASWGISSRAIPGYKTLDAAGYMENIFHAYRADMIYEYDYSNEEASLYAIEAMRDGLGSYPSILGVNEQYNPFNYPIDELFNLETGKIRSDAKLRYNQDWMDELTAENPLRQEYTLTASGGTEKTKYMYSLGYLNEEGILKTTKFERFSGRVNIDTELHKYVKGGMNFSYTRSTSNTTNTSEFASSNVFYSAQLMPAIYPIYELDQNGNTMTDPDTGKPLFDYGYSRPPGALQRFNSIATLFDDKYENTNDNVSGRTYLEVGNFDNLLKGLKLTFNLGFDQELENSMTYYNPYFGNSQAVKGYLQKSDDKTFSYTTNQLLTYNNAIGDHRFDILLGHEFYSYTFNYLMGEKTGFPLGGLYELDAAANVTNASSYKNEYAIESILSRINYDYKNKYYLSGSFRRDASSRFFNKNYWGNFWSVGASWRISEEDLLQGNEWLDNLTFKTSYGIQGNDNIKKFYAWQSLFDLNWSNTSLSGALLNQLENKNLSWEKNGNLNIGIETRLFNRFGGTIEWYQRTTNDLLLFYPKAPSIGIDGYYKNIGEVRNRGIEFSLYGDLVRTKDFRWTLSVVGSTIKNKVTDLADRSEIISGNYIIKEGETLNSFYTTISAGVDPETGNQLYKVWEEDENGKRIYTETDNTEWAIQCREITGSRIPDIYGSFSNEFQYKDFDLSILCTYSLGGKILDYVYNDMITSYYVGQAVHADLENAWKYPGDITDIPRSRFSHNSPITDQKLISASYFSLKNITLGYSLPSNWMKNAGMESVRFFATGDNLFLFTNRKGMDPQYNFIGGNDYIYTPSRIISFGLDVRF